MSRGLSIASSVLLDTEESEQMDEQIDEVEVERESAVDHEAGDGSVSAFLEHLAELLHVVGGEAGEEQHGYAAYCVVHDWGLVEDVHDKRDEESDEPDKEERSHRQQVDLRNPTKQRATAESPCRDEEDLGDAGVRVGVDDRSECDTV